MAAPFVYVPEASASTSSYDPYHNPYYPPAGRGFPTPFLPPAPLIYPDSPYTSPNAFNPDRVLWPEAAAHHGPAHTAPWIAFAPRQLVHPFLNGEKPCSSFHFNLAPAAFQPLQLISTYPLQSAVVGGYELSGPAFDPPIFSLRILHPRLPFWPIDIPSPAGVAQAHPISLGDVLAAIHRAMHTRISHADWATLGAENEALVTRAFVARCRAEAMASGASPAQLHDREVAVRNNGVLRVDFLLGKTVLKGLVRHPEGYVQMVTA